MFTRSGFQNQFLVLHLPDNPVLIDLIRVEVPVWSGGDVSGPFPRRKTIFLSGAYHPIVDFKTTLHDRLQPVQIDSDQ